MLKRFSFLLSCTLVCSITGCKGEVVHYKTAPVSGILTCQGKPVPGVQVNFSPQSGEGRSASMPGKSASGKTDSNGRFTLSTYDINDGAVVGIHNVSVSIEEDSENPQQAAVSLKLLRPCLNATLEIEVKAEKNEIDLKLGE